MAGFSMRTLNSDGIDRFRHELDLLISNPAGAINLEWIHEDESSQMISPSAQIESHLPDSKLEAAELLSPLIRELELPNKYYHQGLWSWLSAYFFDSVCPPTANGERKPGESYRHIPPANRNWRTIYRHLLAGPVRIYELHDYKPRVLLNAPINSMGDFMEQLASRQELAGCEGILQAADNLYWDYSNASPKKGARATDRAPGTLRRFVDVIQQLMLTHDLYSLDGEGILKLLPFNEFAGWMPEPIASKLG